MDFSIKPVSDEDKGWVLDVVRGWGDDFVVTRCRKVYPTDIPGFLAERVDGRKVGLATYEIIGDQCELVTLDAFDKFRGIGTALTEHVKKAALGAGCKRLWLITTNDNVDAIRFYQKRGFTIAAIHVNAMEHSRRIKPAIPRSGQYAIPIRDEIEFEMWL